MSFTAFIRPNLLTELNGHLATADTCYLAATGARGNAARIRSIDRRQGLAA